MRRALVLVPVLLLGLAPAASGAEGGCGGNRHRVPTLTVSLAEPSTMRAGQSLLVSVAVQRSAVPADAVEVALVMRYGPAPDDYLFATGRTDLQGRAPLTMGLPKGASGPVRVTAYASSPVATVPCYGEVVEHGEVSADWGRVAR